ncbi:MAG: sigma-70 family RNA polymerase sigma factor [Oscillibacter sp.]|jgi:RNA polymerase sigma-70 factor (ECF subfamily)|nr:sigma-70 family RNA polymerase sigma factor [Oscillibacter sp.]
MNQSDKNPPGPQSGAEQEWVAAARRGDPDAFESLVLLYEKRVYSLALRLCSNADDAQEAAQEAFFSAWRGLPDFRGGSSFSTWLYRLTSNACIDLLRRERRHRSAAGPSLNDEELNLELPDPAPAPEERAESAELRAAVEAGLQSLQPEYRSVLVLRELRQLPYEEIARILELDLGTVKSRISRGRKQLRRYLSENGNFFAARPSKEPEKEGCK